MNSQLLLNTIARIRRITLMKPENHYPSQVLKRYRDEVKLLIRVIRMNSCNEIFITFSHYGQLAYFRIIIYFVNEQQTYQDPYSLRSIFHFFHYHYYNP